MLRPVLFSWMGLTASCAGNPAMVIDGASADISPVDAVADTLPSDVVARDAAPDTLTFAPIAAIFHASCSGYCHAGGPNDTLVLDPANGAAPQLLNRPSTEVPRLMVVAPGDPAGSYLMLKVEGTMRTLPECMVPDAGCGVPMPYALQNGHGVVSLPADQRDLIRQWIAAGAPGAGAL